MSTAGGTSTANGPDTGDAGLAAAGGATGETGAGGTGRRTLLRGLPWLVWRRHRGAFRVGLLLTVAGCALFAYQRIGVMDYLNAHGVTPDSKGRLLMEFQDKFNELFSSDAQFLASLPALTAVFLGAPLIAGEQESGTIKLVTTQSVGRTRWLAATLGLPLALAVLCTALLTAAFTWLWSPAHELAMFGDWLGGGAFESTGPVLVSMTLFLTSCGIAIGMLIKRVVPAMAVTAVVAVVTSVIWTEKVRVHLGTLRNLVYPYHAHTPDVPRGAVRVDNWVSTADGKLFGYGTCSNGGKACLAEKGIVNRVDQYFDYSQMAGMQWLGAGFLLALTALVLGFVVWRARRRPL
ncbi:ABC transporter permease subunit [Streptomyces sp. NPDC101393]|uniref:ABC transporter permease subunit n=1 Tax=Streptomyces sp. NPDC101393 TaxID=3366141 RepID=UPI0038151EAA